MTEIIINLESRRARRFIKRIDQLLTASKFDKNRLHIIEDAKQLPATLKRANQANRVIVGGGDGSILAAVNTYAKSDVSLGILPLGTANNFSQVLGMNPDPLTALQDLLDAERSRRIHLGKANDTYFTSMTTIGISAVVNKEIDNKLKSRLGTGAYAVEGVRQLANHKSFRAHVNVDGAKESFTTHEIIVANTALNLPFNMNIDFELERDELLIVSLSKTASRIKQLSGLFKLMNKIDDDEMMVETGRAIEIKTEPKHRPFECDGEHIGDTPLSITLEKNALNVIDCN